MLFSLFLFLCVCVIKFINVFIFISIEVIMSLDYYTGLNLKEFLTLNSHLLSEELSNLILKIHEEEIKKAIYEYSKYDL